MFSRKDRFQIKEELREIVKFCYFSTLNGFPLEIDLKQQILNFMKGHGVNNCSVNLNFDSLDRILRTDISYIHEKGEGCNCITIFCSPQGLMEG